MTVAAPTLSAPPTAKMGQVAGPNIQHIGILAGSSRSRINARRPHFASRTPPSSHPRSADDKTILKKHLSPHPIQLLRSHGVHIANEKSKMTPTSSKTSDARCEGIVSSASINPSTPFKISDLVSTQHEAAAIGNEVDNSTNLFTPISVSSFEK